MKEDEIHQLQKELEQLSQEVQLHRQKIWQLQQRILQLTNAEGHNPSTIKIKPAQKFSLEKRLRNSFGVHSAEGTIDVVIQFNERVADYIREKKWHPSQVLKDLPDMGIITLSYVVARNPRVDLGYQVKSGYAYWPLHRAKYV